MADASEVKDRLLDDLADICADEGVRDDLDEDLFTAGLLDSMGAIELLVAIEEDFGVKIAPTAVPRDQMNTANKIIAQVASRL
ncbi:MAG: D-alanine--poly(phosphoribitol) ligase subunit DltC [Atopobiaceae bacterium]|jgi:D-alanine--poly(phosphoribitol) ligase subunit 2|nr:D-alanine--poly(phosphoribitol) ligase subunit DltC [Atopobiaceae bacterium]MCH4180130.1 D-alanine--poly(phosphoribitol) ligase subunit DltC [Atopobiaceae bacterium]MCH4213818.1 D-alanine--poly(phosphoribitol) ligase subunit DltC [Atopobiaceae bacterium]MCH4229920.1 D-alanine--poly(phosphoribitol) ligase subunit DltC [Atopobiaceae bacterium]MCH4275719.1 D-alanine--poly(phosphoribitol) ligase subunit DltC [Atopobiaceae bacterium]